MMSIWEAVIGLEIHAQLWVRRKLFSISKYSYVASPNSCVSYFDMAMPGTLPMVNKGCIKLGVLAALALNCNVSESCEFDRKHYFYSDLPCGYQITQSRKPLAKNGVLKFLWNKKIDKNVSEIKQSSIQITQIQLEQDSGKSVHDLKRNLSLVDLNRAGVGLIEIITDCKFQCGDEAAGFVRELRDLLRDLKVCSGKMEEGTLRVDANVSLRRKGDFRLGERTEVKNINSIGGVKKAIEYEILRHKAILEAGNAVINETRFYNPVTEATQSLRDKEVLQDYRYIPEPNIPSFNVYSILDVENLKQSLQSREYPINKRKKLTEKFGLTYEQATAVMMQPGLYEWIDQNSAAITDEDPKYFICFAKEAITLLLNRETDLDSILKGEFNVQKFIEYTNLCADCYIGMNFKSQIIDMIMEGDIKLNDRSIKSIVDDNDWVQINDEAIIENVVNEYFDKLPAKSKRKYSSFAVKNYSNKIVKMNPNFNYKIVKRVVTEAISR